MTSRIVRVGRGKHATMQVVTTQWLLDPNGDVREHVTLATPSEQSDTAKLRLMSARERGHTWPT